MSGFGEGDGELLTLTYPKPLPMRLDRWLVSQRPEQSRAHGSATPLCASGSTPKNHSQTSKFS